MASCYHRTSSQVGFCSDEGTVALLNGRSSVVCVQVVVRVLGRALELFPVVYHDLTKGYGLAKGHVFVKPPVRLWLLRAGGLLELRVDGMRAVGHVNKGFKMGERLGADPDFPPQPGPPR